LTCSRKCRDKKQTIKLKDQRQMTKTCELCGTSYQTGRKHSRYCSKPCYYSVAKKRSSARWAEYAAQAYPDNLKTKICRWCNEPMQVKAQRSHSSRLYHPECSVEAQRARYRIKTVKRQSKTRVWRISPDQVVKEYGETCHICSKPIDIALKRTHRYGLTVDHLVPLSRGGKDDMSNLRPAHWICNVYKSDKLMEELDAQPWQKL